ncbi:hypothetical protein ACIA5C_00840 [Actinoplanes sp. NPDC051343]|uniref:hypothetical protein n=1 Tax=Actinoplanes sp. NPDC051343 TaxID=3363906 RepID=UPI0037B3B5B5
MATDVVNTTPLPSTSIGEPLHGEARVAILPATHPLAGRESLAPEDLAGENLVACTSTPTMWSRPPKPEDSFEDKLEIVASGAVAVLPAGDRRSTRTRASPRSRSPASNPAASWRSPTRTTEAAGLPPSTRPPARGAPRSGRNTRPQRPDITTGPGP